MDRLSIRNWQTAFESGIFDEPDRRTQISAGWFDWFCKTSSLANKTKKMGSYIMKLENGGKVDIDKTYVFFKNNCPLNGPLYDDFRICDFDSGNVLFTIQINCVWNHTKYAVYGRTLDGVFHDSLPLFQSDKIREVIKWLNSPWEKKR